MKSIYNGAGYLLNDNRCSGGKVEEADLIACRHCQKLMKKAAWQEDGGFCGHCERPVCGGCADKILTGGCTPFVAKLEQQVEIQIRRRQNARVMGI